MTSTPLPDITDPSTPQLDAYALLSKSPVELSDAEVEVVIADLRRRRSAFLSTGKPDNAQKEAKAKAPKAPPRTAKEKADLTKQLAAELKLDFGDMKL